MRILILIVLTTCAAFAQPDLTGDWKGTLTYKKIISEMELVLEQEANILSGEALVTRPNGEYFRYKVSGALKKNVATVKGYEVIESTGSLWCLPTIVVTYSKDDNEELTGKWRHNFVIQGCLPGVSGGLRMEKVETTPEVVAAVRQVHDNYTTQMIEGLQERNYHALIIAVEDYADPDMLDLDQPIKDAKLLANTLTTGYAFETEHMEFLANPTRSEIINALDKYANELTEKDNLLIFYAGHGIWDSNIEQGFWLPSDAKKRSKADWISNGTIRDYLKAIDTQHTLLVTDACFSGGILKERNAFTEGKAMSYLYRMPSRKAMTSGTLTTVPDKSVFLEFLIKNLERNEDPLLSAEQLFFSIKLGVINNSPNGQVPQYGVVFGAKDEGGDFIFLKK